MELNRAAHWDSETFKEKMLLQARTMKLLPTGDYPHQIMLGPFWAKLTSRMRAETAGHNREVNCVIKTNLDATQLLASSKELAVGTEFFVTRTVSYLQFVDSLGVKQTQKKIGSIHTHNIPSGFSTLDLAGLTTRPAALFEMLILPSEILLAVRTKNTSFFEGPQEEFESYCKSKYSYHSVSRSRELVYNLLIGEEFGFLFYRGESDGDSLTLKRIALRRKQSPLETLFGEVRVRFRF